MHDRDATCELAQEGGFLERRVATTHDCDVLVTEEESVTRRTSGYAVAEQSSLVLEPQVAVLRTRRENHRARVEDLVADVDHLDGSGEVDLGDVIGHQLGAEAGRLLAQALHQLWAHDPVGKPGEVLDFSGRHQRAAGRGRTFEHQRVQVGARRIERRGVTGRAGSDDDEFTDVH